MKHVCICGKDETETKYIYTRKENRRSRQIIIPGVPARRDTVMPRAVRTVLHALSYGGIEVDASRKLADIKKMDPMRIFYKTLDAEVYNGDYKVPIRLFFPTEEAMENGAASGKKPPVILFSTVVDGLQKAWRIISVYVPEWRSPPVRSWHLWSTGWHRNTVSRWG